MRRALAGKYAVQRVAGEGQRGGRGARDFSSGEHEYLLDACGRILFHRYQTADAAFPGLMRTTILEFTDSPAIRCTDRKAYPERRRRITYYEDHTGWHIGNPMVVDEEGSAWATGSPGYDLLHTGPDNLRDAGQPQQKGRPSRGLTLSRGATQLITWLDVQSALPVVETRIVTMEGRRIEVSALWSYPPPRPITRPAGISIPDCM